MRYRKATALCVVAVCVAIGVALLLIPRRPPELLTDPALPPASNGGALAQAVPVPPSPSVLPPAPQPEAVPPLADARPRRSDFLQLAPLPVTVDRYRYQRYCPADFNRDDTVDEADLTAYLESWQTTDGTTPSRIDTNGDGVIDGADVTEFLSIYFDNDCDTARLKTRRNMAAIERAQIRGRLVRRRTVDIIVPQADSP